MNKEESEGYVKTSINNCLKKMAEQPEEFFDNYKLQEKYNKVIKENINLKQALNEIREYANSDKLLKRFSEPRINAKGETHFDLIRNDILQIIDKVGGNDEKK